LKRKASLEQFTTNADASSPKRARLDSTNNEPTSSLLALKEQNQDRRTSMSREEEKKRGRRLFGGLLNTLSQTTSNNSNHKKRQDVERRHNARVQQRRVEDDKHREEKLAKLKQVRLTEQVRFDEQAVRLLFPTRRLRSCFRPTDSHGRCKRDIPVYLRQLGASKRRTSRR
jgi:hypothetical protein